MQAFIQRIKYTNIQPYVRFAHVYFGRLVDSPPRIIFDYEAVYIRQGAGTIKSAESEVAFSEGSLLLIPPYVEHAFLDEPSDEHSHIAIHFDWEPRVRSSDLLWSPIGSDIPVEEKRTDAHEWLSHITVIDRLPVPIAEIMAEIAEEYGGRSEFRTLALQTRLQQFTLELVQHLTCPDAFYFELKEPARHEEQLKEHAEVQEVIAKIAELPYRLPMDKGAFKLILKSTYFSETHFRRLFKAHTGFSPYQYFTMLRLRKAAELLVGTEKTVNEISYLCGFDDPKYFSKAFRQAEGMSPQQYRCSIRSLIS